MLTVYTVCGSSIPTMEKLYSVQFLTMTLNFGFRHWLWVRWSMLFGGGGTIPRYYHDEVGVAMVCMGKVA